MDNKLVKKDRLNGWEKHKVESPFFAAASVQAALEGRGIFSMWGISEFASEHKAWLSSDSITARRQIESIFESQKWYLVCDRPFNPMLGRAND